MQGRRCARCESGSALRSKAARPPDSQSSSSRCLHRRRHRPSQTASHIGVKGRVGRAPPAGHLGQAGAAARRSPQDPWNYRPRGPT
eukprot:581435-Rhodomonas_salina.1